ncbi:hypothetical protein ES319_A06G069200v1 [Gossypium barbadense]|uniref:Major facilitator superfamily (MFS) profile domain-containing protein n=2 Tax=Gossypium TaxID=3633 RepID=A0A5J5VBD0_GOSBA|nr:hypothetical protein ES319_A06G069200v1 [Gossypium barbadense]TYH12566.1 hypothetical protein ES288_A06G078300v1 [Gossypium darwinii]
MHFSSPEKLDKQHYYHLLPDSDLKNSKGFIISEPPKHKSQQQGRFHFKKYALAATIPASTNSVLLGYNIRLMSGGVLYIKDDLQISSTQQQILVGSLNVFSLISSLAFGKTSDAINHRYTIVLAAATFFVGALLMGLAPSFPFLMAGRLVARIGVGYSLMIGPVYTTEISPAMTRGFLSSFPEIFINMGILLGYISNFALSGLPQPLNWRLMLGLAVLPAGAVALGVITMLESPRWLRVLIKTSNSETEADMRLVEMAKAAGTLQPERSLGGLGPMLAPWLHPYWRGQGVWKELLRPTRPIRQILITSIGINFFMQASGNDTIVYYSPKVFKDAGIHDRRQQFNVTVVMGIVKTCFVFISALYLDHFGRWPLQMLGTIGMAFSLAGLRVGSNYLEQSNEKPVLAITLCIVAVYSSEIFPMRLRGQGSSLAILVNRIVSGIVSIAFLSISNKITFERMFLHFQESW